MSTDIFSRLLGFRGPGLGAGGAGVDEGDEGDAGDGFGLVVGGEVVVGEVVFWTSS